MSTQALKTIATGQPVQADTTGRRTAVQLLQSPNMLAQLKTALPRVGLTPDRMLRIVMTEVRKTPKLQECEPMSFIGAVFQCAQLGLEPGSALGHVYILPYERRKKIGGEWQTVAVEAQVILGYRGMLELVRRSGQVASLDARAVYEGDTFACCFGLHSDLTHEPAWDDAKRTDKPLRLVYAVATLKDGSRQFEVMTRAEIDAIRARSKSKDSGPWVTDFVPMALKTVVRRLFKFLPVSIELDSKVQRILEADERADAGIAQDLADLLTIDAELPQQPEPLGAVIGAPLSDANELNP